MKQLRIARKFQSYTQMCEALDIKPAQRRLSRDRQKERIQEKYQMVIHANNSITLTPLTKAEREEQDYKRAEEARLIIDIGDAIVDVRSRDYYAETGIDRLILDRAITCCNDFDSKQGFVTTCFYRSKLYRGLIWAGECSESSKKYDPEVAEFTAELILARLSSIVNSQLRKLEAKGLIKTRSYYTDKSGGEYEADEVKPIIKKALDELQLKSEYLAYQKPKTCKEFLTLRNRYFQETFEDRIDKKHFTITPIEKKYADELERVNAIYTQGDGRLELEEFQDILTAFLHAFRERLCYSIDKSRHTLKKRSRTNTMMLFHGDEIKEIVRAYCVYTPPHKRDQPELVFSTLQELRDYRALSMNSVEEDLFSKFRDTEPEDWSAGLSDLEDEDLDDDDN